MKSGVELIAQERAEQIVKHGRTIELDTLCNKEHQLGFAAVSLLYGNAVEDYLQTGDFNALFSEPPFDWDKGIWERMNNKPYKERLIIAGALIAAEIDRINS